MTARVGARLEQICHLVFQVRHPVKDRPADQSAHEESEEGQRKRGQGVFGEWSGRDHAENYTAGLPLGIETLTVL
jgi:hypothetical protein